MIFNMTGGGSGGAGGGATLVVSCPANVTVTVSKDDKSYTKNSGNLGSATFKGLTTGTWTVKIQSSSQTATKNITITADYAITIAFFAAYINITYPANSTCVVQTSGGTTVASDSNTGTSTKTWEVTVSATGTYTITATATDGSGKSKSTTVSITADGQSKSVTLSYELVLFDNGSYASATGGWNGISGNYLVASVSGVASGDEKSASFTSKKSVDLSGYSTIYFTIYSFSGTSEQHNGTLSAGGASLSLGEGSSGTKSFDISAVSSGVIKGTAHAWGGGANCTLMVSKVWVN